MSHNYIVHYAEIGLKGQNRPDFEHQLLRNIRAQHQVREVHRLPGRITVEADHPIDLGRIFGIAWWAPVVPVPVDLEAIAETVLDKVGSRRPGDQTFAIRAKQGEKVLGMRTQALEADLGRRVQNAYELSVDLSSPDLTIYVEITRARAFIFTEKRPGSRGLPVGVSGKMMGLFSAGIDSTVAAYLMAKRGASLELVHFYALPSASAARERKIGALTEELMNWLPELTVHYVPYHAFQLASAGLQKRLQRQELVVFRRLMARVAQALGTERGASALFTGDNLGQVASQTIENLAAVDAVLDMPLLRPLIAYDKQEIIDFSQRIGLFELAKLPYRDCCSIIARHPSTVAKYPLIDEIEELLDVRSIVAEMLAETTTQRLSTQHKRKEPVRSRP